MTNPTDQTPNDSYKPAESRTVPIVAREYTVSLSTSTDSADLKTDVKSVVVKPVGAAITCWVSYDDGTTNNLAGVTVESSIQASPDASKISSSKTNATNEKTLMNIPDGVSQLVIQESEFNKVNCESSGTATVYVWPGRGLENNVN